MFNNMKIQPVIQRFSLSQETKNEILSMTPVFGFNGLGEVVFRRTYSRDNESWNDVVIRVVEGTLSIRKEHFFRNSLHWNDNEWQSFSRNFAISLFNMEWLPPGRGLWMMGTDFTYNKGAMALNNCFKADTKFWTKDGLKSFNDFEDGEQVSVRGKNKWIPATIKSFGEQEIWKLTIQKKNTQREIYTTSGHRWITKTKKGDRVFNIKTTEELQENWKLQSFAKRTNFHIMEMCAVGIQHGMVFGDGTFNHATNNCSIKLCGDKKELSRFFFSSRRDNTTITCLPNTWKDLPLLSVNKEYLFGFLAGWFATDGYVSKASELVISNKDTKVLEWLRSAFFILDILTSPIGLSRELSPVDGSYKPSYRVRIYHDSLPESFFLQDLHRERYKPCKENPEWKVVDVERTGLVETVWCVVEPEFEEFTLEDGVLTKNCAATDTAEDFVLSAEWTMDALMNGVGVGFTTYWRGEASVPDKEDTEIFVIPDSREGWVQSLIVLMCSYIHSPRYGKTKFPTFDYSQIRKVGEVISGFGGLASGSDPLEKLHNRVESYLESFCLGHLVTKDGKQKEYNHTRLVADVFNAIGACVVAGNVRRSAQISMGDVEDNTFINLKNYIDNPERGEIGWMSNNSVVLKPNCDYEDFSAIPEMARRIRDNGEPGMINLVNVQKYGRYGKEMKDEATLVNPCFSGDTMIAVADGRGAVSIKELAEENKDVPVYSMNPESGDISIKWGRNPRITGHNQKLLRIHFSHTHKDQFMDVTPNHKFFTTDGRKVEAKDLCNGDSLPVFKKSKNGVDDYIVVYNKGRRLTEHRMIKEFYDEKNFYKTYKEGTYNGCCRTNNVVVHHKDENKTNNHPDNLEITTASDHNRVHNEEYIGEGNPMFGRTHTDETKQLIGNKAKLRCEDPEYRQMLKDAQTPELREKSSKRMKIIKSQWIKEYYDNIEQTTDLTCIRLSDTELKVVKTCENQLCQSNFLVPWSQREHCFCSRSCVSTRTESIESRKKGQQESFEKKSKSNFHKQVMIYKNLQENIENVQKLEWINACKEQGITYKFNRKTSNPYIAPGWKEFKEMADEYNHRVSHIEELDGEHTVYNMTVEDNHTLAVVTKMNDEKTSLQAVVTFNCGEIPLCNFELCNLSETFPPRCANKERFVQALKFATFYSSTVSLLPTHRPETNAIVAKNRRIGVSISGISQWASGEVPEGWGNMNYTKLTRLLRDGYGIVRTENSRLANQAGIPESIRVTTIKPSGSISLLAGVTPGVHYPVSRYAIRRMRIGNNSPLVPALIAANIPHEKDTYSDNTLVFEFVIDHGNVRPCQSVSPWEQFGLVAMLQRCYSDNCVSATIYFDKEKDSADVEKLLAMYIPVLKSVSMLPHSGHNYLQAPYEEINEEKYNELKNSYRNPEFNAVQNNVPIGSQFCSGDTCEL